MDVGIYALQAARYVSLAYALGPPPLLAAPERSDDLPGGVLEVLDFAPLVREFYKKSGIDERLLNYTRAYQAEGDRLRRLRKRRGLKGHDISCPYKDWILRICDGCKSDQPTTDEEPERLH